MASSKLPIYTALAANLAIAVTKFIAAGITGSSAMISEGIHSLVDTVNEIFLLIGIKKSKMPADERRPFGYGKELYFWAFIVSILIFGLGGGISFYEGIMHLRHPSALTDPFWNYIVLAIAFAFDGLSFITAFKEFNRQRGKLSFWAAVKRSKDPSTFVVLFEDAADLLGLIVAFLGVYLGHLFHLPFIDGLASIVIGVILTVISLLLARESRSLLMGESADTNILKNVIMMTEADPSVERMAAGPLSMYMAPEEIFLVLKTVFSPDLSTAEILRSIERIKNNIQTRYPNITRIFIQPEAGKK